MTHQASAASSLLCPETCPVQEPFPAPLHRGTPKAASSPSERHFWSSPDTHVRPLLLNPTHMQLRMGQHLSRQLALCAPQRGFCSSLLRRCLLHASHLHNSLQIV